ncbi:GumC family protein [Algibacter lectus]|uniref:non-specific protein-tyrosine kinase n=1 Tax=Algibacter lectus TaxID=221126 RepID=A0A4R8M9B7_9FLAO|nr:tyrosine-protein kinase [Algibacter lectus]MWW25901.1 polysaccharide biosynthesis tyrosine autokinase [Algibacter lectus]TDY60627.1 capsular exopolysaccharide synthesis family protein [Algibacter lectus]
MSNQEKFQDFMLVEEESINIRQQIEKYLFYWKWFALGLIMAIMSAIVYLRYTPNSYEVSTTILIDDEGNGGLSSELAAFEELGIGGGNKKNIENEMGILKSRSLMTRVVKKLDLNISYFKEGNVRDTEIYKEELPFKASFFIKDSTFFDQGTSFTIKVLSDTTFELSSTDEKSGVTYTYGESIIQQYGDLIITPIDISKDDINTVYIVNTAPLKAVVNSYIRAINVSLLYEKASILELKLKSPVKLKAQRVLDELIRQYNKDAIEYKSLIGNNTDKFINERLELIEEDLKKVDKTAETFKTTNQLTDIPLETGIVLETNSVVEKEIIDLNTQLKLVNYVTEHMSSGDHSLIPENLGINASDVNSSSNQYNEILLERNRIAQSSGKSNPVLLNLEAQLSQLRSSVSQGLTNLKRSLSISLEQAKSQERSIDSRITSAPRKEREFRDIQRQQQIIETLYLFLLKKREENSISLAVTVPNAKLIDAADGNDDAVSPKRKMIYAVALFLGLLIPFVILSLIFILDTKIHNQEDLEDVLKTPIIGNIPKTLDGNKILTKSDRGNVAEAFRMLRTNMNFMLGNLKEQSKAIYVTSTIPGEGKTFVSINLATVLAMSNKKVLLIGADVRKPKVAEYLDMTEATNGLTVFLADKSIQINQIIETAKNGDFDVIQSGMVPPNPSELLINGRFDEVLNYGKEHYDYVIVDTAPVNMVTDTLQIASKADLFIYLVRANYLDKRLLEIPKKLYNEKRIPNMTVVINGTDVKKGYGYGNGYGYGYGHEEEKKSWLKRLTNRS